MIILQKPGIQTGLQRRDRGPPVRLVQPDAIGGTDMQEAYLVSLDGLTGWIREVLGRAGVPPKVRRVEAEIMAEADLFGVPSHGVRMLPGLVRAIDDGRVSADPKIEILRDRGPVAVLDCDNGPGRYVSAQAMAQAVVRAREHGIGVCLALRTTHWGRAHAYVLRAARNGMIGICTTNAIPNMTAWDSRKRLLGNNPLAIGVPRGSGADPFVLDMAMSQAALGKVGTASRERRKAGAGWGLDPDGRPTDDPDEILSSGLLLPFGGHKGAGLAFMMELLTAAMGGGPLSQEVVLRDASGIDQMTTKLFLALDPEAFAEPGVLEERSGALVEWIREQADSPVHLPGQRGDETRRRFAASGIPIHPEIADQLSRLEPAPDWL
jgi:LDH2 family malate/lactate/ureidoglycolate dehydrogenase